MMVVIIVSADLSGMGNPVRWLIIVRMCLFPEIDVSHSITKLIAICQMICLGSLSFVWVGLDLGLFSAA